MSDDAVDLCEARHPRVFCELPAGHKGDHMAPSDDLSTVAQWPQGFVYDAPLVEGGQGRDASEISDVRWVGAVIMAIISGIVGTVVTALAIGGAR